MIENFASAELKKKYGLQPHPEGGWFAERWTSAQTVDGRALAGSICFLLDGTDVSHFHQLDCNEVWYFHEGCGMKLTVFWGGRREIHFLGNGTAGEVQVIIPKGAVFAAENWDTASYTFVSCVTVPSFRYEGFRLVHKEELLKAYPEYRADIERLAYA
ncbi:MAG: cupin domain-containing protein [Lachnospiraceae bacterium]|nr:cupin domain-containing protein [Lachnospiraceae bacterium]